MRYAVRFTPRFTVVNKKPNTLGLAGSGEIELTDEFVIIQCRKHRPFWFAKRQVLRLPRSEIVNVHQTQKEVFFQPQRGIDTIRVWLETPALAQALAIALPQEKTPEFAQQLADQKAFADQLNALGTKARVTPALVALNAAVFALLAANGAGILQPDMEVITRWGSNFGPLTMNGEWWRLETATFIHLGLVHLLLNMWALWSGGIVVERLYGSLAFLLLYAFSGIGASLASLAWNPTVNSAGASGAIFGIYGALLAFFTRGGQGIPQSIVRSQSKSAGVFIAYSLSFGLTHAGIDNAAHVGGLLTGLAMGWLLARPIDAEARKVGVIGHLGRAMAVGLALIGVLSYPALYPNEAARKDQQFMRDIGWIQKQEQLVGDKYNALVSRAQSHQLSDQQFAQGLDAEVIPGWSELQGRVRQDQVASGSRVADLYNFLAKYVQLHAEGLHLLHDALARGDSNLMKQATAKFKEQEQLLDDRKRAQSSHR